jgi:hypothetical protein
MIKINFDKFNEIGLKPIIKEFEKEGFPIARVEADNKPKREAGFLCKTATFFFESEQKLSVKAKADGGIFQVKLNNKAIPIKNVDDLDKAVKEVIAFVEKNEPTFLKRKKASMSKQKIAIPKIRSVRTSTVQQTEEMAAALEEVSDAVSEIERDKMAFGLTVSEKQATVTDLKRQLAAENDKTDQLQIELDRLQEAA